MTRPANQTRDERRKDTAGAPAGAWLRVLGLIAVAAIVVAVVMAAFQPFDPLAQKSGVAAPDADRAVLGNLSALNVDDADQIIVKGADAVVRNEALPMSMAAIEPARAFRLASEETANGRTAVKCLTQAIYYEAGFEPAQGRRAVAQVVLNRVRHPAYPRSVCGVVYQGSNRRTGCQFSFTCDGSLLRAPAPGAWREAEKIARAALAGSVEKSVGTSTHYHADYVLPKWAFTLGKLEKIGRHIFYRFKGRSGREGAFTAGYSGGEVIPAIDFALLRQRLSEDGEGFAEADFAPGLTVPPHVTDRHASNDVGGRLDTRKEWRLNIPDPTAASAKLREAVADSQSSAHKPGRIALTEPEKPVEAP